MVDETKCDLWFIHVMPSDEDRLHKLLNDLTIKPKRKYVMRSEHWTKRKSQATTAVKEELTSSPGSATDALRAVSSVKQEVANTPPPCPAPSSTGPDAPRAVGNIKSIKEELKAPPSPAQTTQGPDSPRAVSKKTRSPGAVSKKTDKKINAPDALTKKTHKKQKKEDSDEYKTLLKK